MPHPHSLTTSLASHQNFTFTELKLNSVSPIFFVKKLEQSDDLTWESWLQPPACVFSIKLCPGHVLWPPRNVPLHCLVTCSEITFYLGFVRFPDHFNFNQCNLISGFYWPESYYFTKSQIWIHFAFWIWPSDHVLLSSRTDFQGKSLVTLRLRRRGTAMRLPTPELQGSPWPGADVQQPSSTQSGPGCCFLGWGCITSKSLCW